MIKKGFFLTLILTFYVLSFNAQSIKSDTIDLKYFLNKNYGLVKIKEEKYNKEKIVPAQTGLYIWQATNANEIEPRWSKTIKVNDTIMFAEWDVEKDKTFENGHVSGKIILNPKTNILLLEKTRWTNLDKKTLRKFKILKWTKSEVILWDLSDVELKRKYFFTGK